MSCKGRNSASLGQAGVNDLAKTMLRTPDGFARCVDPSIKWSSSKQTFGCLSAGVACWNSRVSYWLNPPPDQLSDNGVPALGFSDQPGDPPVIWVSTAFSNRAPVVTSMYESSEPCT